MEPSAAGRPRPVRRLTLCPKDKTGSGSVIAIETDTETETVTETETGTKTRTKTKRRKNTRGGQDHDQGPNQRTDTTFPVPTEGPAGPGKNLQTQQCNVV